MTEREKMILEKSMEIWHDTFMNEPHRVYVSSVSAFSGSGYYKDNTDTATAKADKAVYCFLESMGIEEREK